MESLDKFRINNRILIFFMLICVASLLSCTNFVEKIEEENIDRIKNIDVSQVDRINIYLYMLQYEYKNKLFVKALNNKAEIEELLNSLKTMVKVNTNHPHYPNRWFVVIELKDNNKEEIMIMQRKGVHNMLYVNCIGHLLIGNRGEAVSAKLYEWMKINSILKRVGRPKDQETKEIPRGRP